VPAAEAREIEVKVVVVGVIEERREHMRKHVLVVRAA